MFSAEFDGQKCHKLSHKGCLDIKHQFVNFYFGVISIDIFLPKTIIRHPEYSKKFKKNDIALIQLTQLILFSSRMRPACLELYLWDLYSDVYLNVTGWGSTSAERKLSIANEIHVHDRSFFL